MDKIKKINIGIFLLIFFFIFFLYNCSYNENKNLGGGFVYFDDNKMISSSNSQIGDIPSSVIEFKYDKRFIIAKQKPIENDPNTLLYNKEYNYSKGYNEIYYWIILKEEKTILGPMTELEYINTRKKFDISENLNLY